MLHHYMAISINKCGQELKIKERSMHFDKIWKFEWNIAYWYIFYKISFRFSDILWNWTKFNWPLILKLQIILICDRFCNCSFLFMCIILCACYLFHCIWVKCYVLMHYVTMLAPLTYVFSNISKYVHGGRIMSTIFEFY